MERHEIEFSKALVSLMKGSVDREGQGQIWQTIVNHKHGIDDYVAKLGLHLFVNEVDGYAYLQQMGEAESEIPVLIPRRKLKYLDSLLLVLFRKALMDFDAGSGEGKCILFLGEIVGKAKVYLSDTTNEVKQQNEITASLKRLCECGFLRKTKSTQESYEVLRIIRSFMDANWLNQLDEKLEEYRNYRGSGDE